MHFPPSLFLVFSSSSPAFRPSLPLPLSFSLCVSLSVSLSPPASPRLSLSLFPPPSVLLEQWLGAAETAGSWGCPRSLIRAAWELGWGRGTGDYRPPCEATASAVSRAGMQHPQGDGLGLEDECWCSPHTALTWHPKGFFALVFQLMFIACVLSVKSCLHNSPINQVTCKMEFGNKDKRTRFHFPGFAQISVKSSLTKGF